MGSGFGVRGRWVVIGGGRWCGALRVEDGVELVVWGLRDEADGWSRLESCAGLMLDGVEDGGGGCGCGCGVHWA